MLTGESAPVFKDPSTLSGVVPLGDRLNMVFKGTAVARGVGRAVVTGTAMDTEVGAIAGMLAAAEAAPTPLQREIAGVSKLLGITVIAIAVVVMATIIVVNGVSLVSGLVAVLLLGVSLAVAAVPEGLPAILSVVLAIGVQNMAKRKAVVKELHSVLQRAFGTASLDPGQWAVCVAMASTVLWFDELRKAALRLGGRRRNAGAPITGAGSRP